MTNTHPPTIPDGLIETLRAAKAVTVLTGAGISAESGIPTFRDAQTGLWAKYDPHELATPQAFRSNPDLVLDWYRWRLQLVEGAAPNAGHYALARMEREVERFTLITQNVDGLHRLAGSHNVIELHGTIRRLRCSDPHCSFEGTGWTEEAAPLCPTCGARLRPSVVWFGEALPQAALETAKQASKNCDLFISVGTSGVVEPAASLAYQALRAGAVLVEVNPQPTPLSVYAKFFTPYPAGQILPTITTAAWGDKG